MGTMLEFILSSAVSERPFTRFELQQYSGLDIGWLEQKGYLHTTGRLASYIMLGKRRCEVSYNRLAKRMPYSYWDEEELVPIPDAEVLVEFNMSYEPIAKLLAEHLGCSPTPEIVIPNKLWNLGAPEMTCEEVFLARNAGTDSAVRQEIASLTKEGMTLYCFGSLPESSAAEASICKLCDYLTWDGSDIRHIEKLPPGIVKASSAYSVGTLPKNLFRKKGNVWDIRYNYGPVKSLKDTVGCAYIAILLSKPNQRLTLDELAPPPETGNTVLLSPEEILNGFETGKGRGCKQDAVDATTIHSIQEYRMKKKAELEDAMSYRDEEEAKKCQDEIDRCEEYLKRNVRPDGKPKNINKANNRQSDAISRACGTVISNIEKFYPALAAHLKSSLKFGNNPIYAPTEENQWST